ncbi:MAG TPA: hypothetical protein VI914_03970 [Thermodesulfobacteriota bacterium]|nr:hypothetical protein [Thermodesulfobacteriota bacterium]
MTRKIFLIPVLFISFLAVFPASSNARSEAGMKITDEGVMGFYLAIGDYFHVPEREVIIIRERRVRDEEIPVVFFLAQRASVSHNTIIKMRLSGMTWLEISLHYGLSPEIFYVPVRVIKGPPYGRAYGYYRNKPRSAWKAIMLNDAEIIDLVNLRFISEHYGYPAEEVIRLRSGGDNFIVINNKVKKIKRAKVPEGVKGRGKGKR